LPEQRQRRQGTVLAPGVGQGEGVGHGRPELAVDEQAMDEHDGRCARVVRPGDAVVLSAVLPAEISIPDFTHLLTLIGKYRGFSPFNNSQEKYGTFEVISVEPVAGPSDDS
jgi:hypothetical protein